MRLLEHDARALLEHPMLNGCSSNALRTLARSYADTSYVGCLSHVGKRVQGGQTK